MEKETGGGKKETVKQQERKKRHMKNAWMKDRVKGRDGWRDRGGEKRKTNKREEGRRDSELRC